MYILTLQVRRYIPCLLERSILQFQVVHMIEPVNTSVCLCAISAID